VVFFKLADMIQNPQSVEIIQIKPDPVKESLIPSYSEVELVSAGPASSFAYETVQSKGQEVQQGICFTLCEYLAKVLQWIVPCCWPFSFVSCPEYKRVLKFRMGKLISVEGPGLVLLNPCTDQLTHVDLRIQAMDIAAQQMMTSDTVTVEVNCVVYIKVVDPVKAIIEVDHYRTASQLFAATSLRSVIGFHDLDTLCTKRDGINNRLRQIIESETIKWGVVVTAVEVKDVVLPKNMQRAMASEAENERERKAKIVNARGEKEAATELAKAAEIITSTEGAMQLRYLHTLKNISVEKNSTIIFPLPMDILQGFGLSRRPNDVFGFQKSD